MPVVHRYVNGRGYYIKTAIQRSIVTYQVAPEGEAYLRRNGWGDYADISPRQLQYMIKRNMVYTGGAGPGEIDPSDKRYKKSKDPLQEMVESCGCCGAQAVTFLLISSFIIVWQWRSRK